jgi:hypothetical protein
MATSKSGLRHLPGPSLPISSSVPHREVYWGICNLVVIPLLLWVLDGLFFQVASLLRPGVGFFPSFYCLPRAPLFFCLARRFTMFFKSQAVLFALSFLSASLGRPLGSETPIKRVQ